MLGKSFVYAASRAVVGVLAMATSILLFRFLGPSESGKIVVALGIVQGAAPLVSMGTAYALIRFAVNAPTSVQRVLYLRAAKTTIIGLVLASGLLCLGPVRRALPPEVESVSLLMAGLLTALAWSYINVCMLRGEGRLWSAFAVESGLELGPRILVLPWLLSGTASYLLYLKLQFALAGAVAVASSLAAGPTAGAGSTRGLGPEGNHELQGYWKFAIQAQLGWLTWWLYVNVPLWVIRHIGSSDTVGQFAVAMRIPMAMISLLLAPLLTPFVYFLAAEGTGVAGQLETMRKGTVYTAALIGTVTLLLAATARAVVPTLFGTAYVPAVTAYLISAHLPFVAALQVFFNPVAIVLNRQHINNWTLLFLIAVQVTIGWAASSIWGIGGMAAVTVLGYLVFSVFVYGVWLGAELRPLPRTAATLAIIYLPFALVATTFFWPLAVALFPVVALPACRAPWRGLLVYIKLGQRGRAAP